MMLSQRIAKYPDFLTAGPWKGPSSDFSALRQEIMNSTKFLVGTHLIGDLYLRDIKTRILGSDTPDPEKTMEKEKQWAKYSRPAFPLMCFENKDALLLVRDITKPGPRPVTWQLQRVEKNGMVNPLVVEITNQLVEGVVSQSDVEMFPDQIKRLGDKVLARRSNVGVAGQFRSDVLDLLNQEQYTTLLQAIAMDSMAISELMLFVNAPNIRIHRYQPQRREMFGLAKALWPKYSYHIVDVFRTRDRYVSLNQIWDDINEKGDGLQQRRAHLVRGHFKETKTGLFWWNPYVRCRKNAKELGVVEKDYRLREE